MIIKCKKTKRFLCEIDMKSYLSSLRLLGIEQDIPLRLIVPCKNCKQIEVYDVFETHYVFIENKERKKNE